MSHEEQEIIGQAPFLPSSPEEALLTPEQIVEGMKIHVEVLGAHNVDASASLLRIGVRTVQDTQESTDPIKDGIDLLQLSDAVFYTETLENHARQLLSLLDQFEAMYPESPLPPICFTNPQITVPRQE